MLPALPVRRFGLARRPCGYLGLGLGLGLGSGLGSGLGTRPRGSPGIGRCTQVDSGTRSDGIGIFGGTPWSRLRTRGSAAGARVGVYAGHPLRGSTGTRQPIDGRACYAAARPRFPHEARRTRRKVRRHRRRVNCGAGPRGVESGRERPGHLAATGSLSRPVPGPGSGAWISPPSPPARRPDRVRHRWACAAAPRTRGSRRHRRSSGGCRRAPRRAGAAR